MKEIWKDVPNWEGLYKISNFGRCLSVKQNKIKALDTNSYGYARLQCYDGKRRDKLFVHRLVAMLFVDGYKEGFVVDHIDGDKTNNIYTNLQWVSRSENCKRAFSLGLKKAKRESIPCYLDFDGKRVYFESIVNASKSVGLSDKRLHHLIKTNNGFIPEIGAYIRKCVSND